MRLNFELNIKTTRTLVFSTQENVDIKTSSKKVTRESRDVELTGNQVFSTSKYLNRHIYLYQMYEIWFHLIDIKLGRLRLTIV